MPEMDLPEDDKAPLAASSAEKISFTVGDAGAGVRLDQLLVQRITQTSRSHIVASIKDGLVLVDEVVRKASYKLKSGERISGTLIAPEPLDVIPQYLDFPILFEDASLIVISKPPGLVVHPGSGNASGTLVNGLVYHCHELREVGDAARPGIVHRLDKDTSGVMVVAKDTEVHRQLVEAFKARQVEKEYIALVHGRMTTASGRIVAPLGRHSVNRQKMAVREGVGRYAASNWRVEQEYMGRYSRLKVHIETGRTHQIRVHLAHIGHPVAGDVLYGPGRDNRLFPRQMLHAWRIVFTHPVSGASLEFVAPLWPDMETICRKLDAGEVM
jgi:23S rRNA pseudouridine1911/1915/1917 synthase